MDTPAPVGGLSLVLLHGVAAVNTRAARSSTPPVKEEHQTK